MSEKSYTAKLVSGASYTLMVPNADNPKVPDSYVFKKGEPKVVSATIKALLDAQAVDEADVRVGNRTVKQTIAKFEFEEVAEVAAPVDTRTRKVPA